MAKLFSVSFLIFSFLDILLRNKQLIKRDYQTITVDGYELLKELNRISKKEKIRNETENNLAIKKTLYLPQTFSGVT